MKDKATYKDLVEVLLAAAAEFISRPNILLTVAPNDGDLDSLLDILTGIEEQHEKEFPLPLQLVKKENHGDLPEGNIEEAAKEYEATVDRPMPEKEKE